MSWDDMDHSYLDCSRRHRGQFADTSTFQICLLILFAIIKSINEFPFLCVAYFLYNNMILGRNCFRLVRNQFIGRKGITALQSPIQRFSSSQGKQSNKLDAYIRLCRYHQPIGAMLLYWPTAWGVLAGSPGLPSLYLLGLFFMGSWTSRSAGCIVNDYWDRDFDKNVERTKSRPLASGEVTVKEAGALLFMNLCGGLFVLFHLPLPALLFTFSVVGLSAVYPLAKRYTNYPQFVLGLGFNSGIIIAALTSNVSTPMGPILSLYAAGICWTMIYDTVYAYQDIEDDLKIGIKSTAIQWKDDPISTLQKWCCAMVLCHGSLTLFDVDYFYPSLMMVGIDYLLWRQIRRLNIKDRQECGKFFRKNNYYGLAIFGSLLVLDIIRRIWAPEGEDKKGNQ